jgi:hypothetical protein
LKFLEGQGLGADGVHLGSRQTPVVMLPKASPQWHSLKTHRRDAFPGNPLRPEVETLFGDTNHLSDQVQEGGFPEAFARVVAAFKMRLGTGRGKNDGSVASTPGSATTTPQGAE